MNIAFLVRVPFTRLEVYVERIQTNLSFFGMDICTNETMLYMGKLRILLERT